MALELRLSELELIIVIVRETVEKVVSELNMSSN